MSAHLPHLSHEDLAAGCVFAASVGLPFCPIIHSQHVLDKRDNELASKSPSTFRLPQKIQHRIAQREE